MNWIEIEKNYPNASDKRLEWDLNRSRVFTTRCLYNFFDENGIMVSVQYIISNTSFAYDIATHINHAPIFKSRTEAEEAAFIKAFSILENKLK